MSHECLLEKFGVLHPIYRLVGRGRNDHEIARRLGVTELRVQGCVGWLFSFLELEHRGELIRHAVSLQSNSPSSAVGPQFPGAKVR